MSDFVVSARKYRPATFDTVVGQQVIVRTLKNAIEKGQLSHAYLFCGSRGVGKTTTARIFAKTINCQNPTADGEACGECESCKAFDEGRSFNIHELDAASNNSVENIRTLIDQVRIPPQVGRYSVYIIDEAHMLTKEAFNTFLKTLEEPPAWAIFIMATTEKQKIISTIISRCQVFDFTRISVDDIVGHLQNIAAKEGVEAEPDALNVIAVKSDGGMRDALSTFDQLVSFAGKKLTYADVISNLNILDYEYFFRFVDFCLKGDISSSLLLFDEVLSKGFEGQVFVSGLLSHLRDLLVAKDGNTAALLQVGAGIRQRYLQQSKACEAPYLCALMEIVNETDVRYRDSRNKRLLVELMLIRMCQLADKKKIGTAASPAAEPLREITPGAAAPQPTIAAQPTAPYGAAAPATPAHKTAAASAAPPPAPPASAAPQAPKATPKPSARPAGLSLSSLLKKTELPRQDEAEGSRVRNTPYTGEQLSAAWFSFPRQIPDRLRLHHFFEAPPSEINGSALTITTDNEMAASELRELLPQLHAFLRDSLDNDSVEVEIRQVEGREELRLHTDADKAKFMAQQNPAVKNLFTDLEMTFE